MRRIAAHRIYHISNKAITCLPLHVVSIDDEGNVSDIVSLQEETAQTEWFGGILLITPSYSPPQTNESWQAYLVRLQKKVVNSTSKAYHIPDFDFESEEMTKHSRITKL